MRRLWFLAPVALLLLAAKTVPPGEEQGGRRQFQYAPDGVTQPYPTGSLVYAFLADAGEVAPLDDICDVAADGGMVSGANSWCLRADGGVTGEAMSIVGAVANETMPVCGNGAYCGNETRQRFGATGEVVTGNVASPTDTFTVCSVFTNDTLPAGGQQLVSKITSNVVQLFTTAGLGVQMTVSRSGASTSIASGNSLLSARSRNIACGRYDYVADGTSIGNVWLNGAQVASKTDVVGPPLVTSNPWRVHAAISALTGTVSGAFYTTTYLSDAQLVTLANATLGGVITPSVGTAPTFTRTTAKYCPVPGEATASFMAINRPCFTNGKYMSTRQVTNRLLQSEDFNTTWTKISDGVTAVPTVTVNTTDVLDPYGTNTADKIDFPAVSGAGNYSLLNQTFTGTANPAAGAIWGRTASGTVTVYQGFNISTPTYHSTACTFTTTWSRCFLKNRTLTAATWNYTLGVDRRDSAQADQGAQTVYLWGAAVNTSAMEVPLYASTTTSAATVTDEKLSVTSPLAGTPSTFCVSAAISPLYPSGAWDTGSANIPYRLYAFGAAAAANNVELDLHPFTTTYRLVSYDSTPTFLGAIGAVGSLTSGDHTLKAIYTPGPFRLYVDGALLPLTPEGTGRAGNITAFATPLYIGTYSGTDRNLSGYISNFRVGTGVGACN